MKVDQIAEPTRPHELLDRQSETVYDDGYLRLERENYYMECGGQPVALMRKEFLIVWRLAQESAAGCCVGGNLEVGLGHERTVQPR
jgi:hypothetical protein